MRNLTRAVSGVDALTNVRVFFSPLPRSGKTTLAMMLAWLFRKHRRRVLFCDLDTKGLASLVFADANERHRPNEIGDLAELVDNRAQPVVTAIERSGFDLLRMRSPLETTQIDRALAILDEFTARIEPGRFYDEVVIDLSSQFDEQHLISFLSADTVIVPVQLNARAIESVKATIAMTGELAHETDAPVRLMVIPTMVKEQSPTQRAVGESLTSSFSRIIAPAFYERAVFSSCIVDGGPFWDAKGIRERKRRLEEVENIFASVLQGK